MTRFEFFGGRLKIRIFEPQGPDIFEFDKRKFPPGFSGLIDDPFIVYDAENQEIFNRALKNVIDRFRVTAEQWRRVRRELFEGQEDP